MHHHRRRHRRCSYHLHFASNIIILTAALKYSPICACHQVVTGISSIGTTWCNETDCLITSPNVLSLVYASLSRRCCSYAVDTDLYGDAML